MHTEFHLPEYSSARVIGKFIRVGRVSRLKIGYTK